MKESVPVVEENRIHVIAQFSVHHYVAENYKKIRILYLYFKGRWIQIAETKRVWKVKAGQFYNYYFKVYNYKNTSFTIVFVTQTQVWEMINYEYEV